MTESKIELKPIKDLLGMNFFIPDYQRGYISTQFVCFLRRKTLRLRVGMTRVTMLLRIGCAWLKI